MKCSQDHCSFTASWEIAGAIGAKKVCGLHLAWGCRSMTIPGEGVVVVQMEVVDGPQNAKSAVGSG